MQQFLDLVTHDPRRHDDAVRGAHHRLGSRLRVLSTLLSVAVVVLACGGISTSVTGSASTSKSTPTPTPTPTATHMSLPSALTNAPFDVTTSDGLRVAGDSIGCEPPTFRKESGGPAFLALATAQLTYNSNDLQQMRAYLGSTYGNPGVGAPPDTLQWVEAAPTTPQMVPYKPFETPAFCVTTLTVKNTNANPIQILQAGMQLRATPQPNPVPYRLIDSCTVIGPNCSTSGGETGDCTFYGAQVSLSRGASGDEYLASPTGVDFAGNPCPVLVLDPGAQVELVLNFGSAEPLVYSGDIEFKVVMTGVQRTMDLSQTPTTLAFADPSQFTCYALQGSTFTVEFQGAAALQGPIFDQATKLYRSICV